MAISTRERYIVIVLLVAVAALVFDRLLLGWYLDVRSDLVDQRTAKSNALDQAHLTLRRELQLRQLVANMNGSLSADSATAEAQLLHQLHDWEQQAGVSGGSFQRSRIDQEHGYTRLTFQIAAVGSQASVAGLIYRLETAVIPLRIESTMVRPKAEGSDELQVHVTVSTLCHGEATNTQTPVAAQPAGEGESG